MKKYRLVTSGCSYIAEQLDENNYVLRLEDEREVIMHAFEQGWHSASETDSPESADYYNLNFDETELEAVKAERGELKAKLAESDLVSRKELLEWLEKHSDFTPTTSYGKGYKIALTDIIYHLTQPKEGEGN